MSENYVDPIEMEIQFEKIVEKSDIRIVYKNGKLKVMKERRCAMLFLQILGVLAFTYGLLAMITAIVNMGYMSFLLETWINRELFRQLTIWMYLLMLLFSALTWFSLKSWYSKLYRSAEGRQYNIAESNLSTTERLDRIEQARFFKCLKDENLWEKSNLEQFRELAEQKLEAFGNDSLLNDKRFLIALTSIVALISAALGSLPFYTVLFGAGTALFIFLMLASPMYKLLNSKKETKRRHVFWLKRALVSLNETKSTECNKPNL